VERPKADMSRGGRLWGDRLRRDRLRGDRLWGERLRGDRLREDRLWGGKAVGGKAERGHAEGGKAGGDRLWGERLWGGKAQGGHAEGGQAEGAYNDFWPLILSKSWDLLLPQLLLYQHSPNGGIHRRIVTQKTKSFALTYSQLRIYLVFTPTLGSSNTWFSSPQFGGFFYIFSL
jgi:hypothetical protein